MAKPFLFLVIAAGLPYVTGDFVLFTIGDYTFDTDELFEYAVFFVIFYWVFGLHRPDKWAKKK